MKKYIVEFVELNGNVYEFEFLTDDIEKSIDEYYRNRSIANHRILNEGTGGRKQMLFG
jgi:hypothetical protein|tara:strand:- start:2189 stop:2362 length:174 start_codon:yes stop_codon:yes gene_type:complete